MSILKKSTAPKAFGDSDVDRRLAGVGDRRVNTSDYRFAEFPKAVYSKDGKSRIVKDEDELTALGGDWSTDVPEVHKDEASHTAAVLKGDGIKPNADVQKVQVVNPDDPNAAAFQKPEPADPDAPTKAKK